MSEVRLELLWLIWDPLDLTGQLGKVRGWIWHVTRVLELIWGRCLTNSPNKNLHPSLLSDLVQGALLESSPRVGGPLRSSLPVRPSH